jgi:hypothetical protein
MGFDNKDEDELFSLTIVDSSIYNESTRLKKNSYLKINK